jgi:hypothetical protein
VVDDGSSVVVIRICGNLESGTSDTLCYTFRDSGAHQGVKKVMSPVRWTLSTAALFLVVSTAIAEKAASPDPLFQSDEILDVRIVAPLTTLLDERPTDEDLPATFRYKDSAGQDVQFDVKIRTRGRFRRQEEVCTFPPMRLNFKEQETKDTLFHKQNKVKLVTHCKGSKSYEQVILREYTAYRILNVMTDASFKVRLLRITYVDSEGKRQDHVNHGIIIEHRDRLAKRLDKPYLDVPRTVIESLDPEHTNSVSLYHYLIGNTDFSPIRGTEGQACCHNQVLFGNEGEPLLSIPYDFDQAGLVDAPHSLPNERFNLSSVRRRLYRGRCEYNDQLDASIADYNSKREEIMAVVYEVDDASSGSEKAMAKYVKKFYDSINSERHVAKKIIKKCI